MNNRALFLAAGLILLFGLLGCGGGKKVVVSDASLKAVEFNRRAETAFTRGDYQKSLRLYNEALTVNRSIENTDGIATELVSIAAVYRRLGENENAARFLDEVLNPSLINASQYQYDGARLAEASFLKAMIRMDEGRPDEASRLSDDALSFCGSSKCGVEGKIYNLKSRILLKSGDFPSAEAHADKALKLNKESGDSEETANSLRLMAESKSSRELYGEAFRLYEDALAIDKPLGLSRKIALDLIGAGNALFKDGRPEDASKYYQRALSVGRAAKDEKVIKEASAMIEKCLSSGK